MKNVRCHVAASHCCVTLLSYVATLRCCVISSFGCFVFNVPIIAKSRKLVFTVIAVGCSYEDHRALYGGLDGLDLIKDIVQVSPRLLNGAGRCQGHGYERR